MGSETRELISKLRVQDPGAMTALVERFGCFARFVIRKHLHTGLRQRIESEDLLNNLWVSVIAKANQLPSLNQSRQLRAFVRQIAIRQVIKQARFFGAKRRTPPSPLQRLSQVFPKLVERTTEPARQSDHGDILDQIALLASPRGRQVLDLRLGGQTNRAIARSLGVDEGTVRRELRELQRTAIAIRAKRDR